MRSRPCDLALPDAIFARSLLRGLLLCECYNDFAALIYSFCKLLCVFSNLIKNSNPEPCGFEYVRIFLHTYLLLYARVHVAM